MSRILGGGRDKVDAVVSRVNLVSRDLSKRGATAVGIWIYTQQRIKIRIGIAGDSPTFHIQVKFGVVLG
jgi:hypothetical protein